MDTKQVHQEVLDAYSAHHLDRPMACRAAEYPSAPRRPGRLPGARGTTPVLRGLCAQF